MQIASSVRIVLLFCFAGMAGCAESPAQTILQLGNDASFVAPGGKVMRMELGKDTDAMPGFTEDVNYPGTAEGAKGWYRWSLAQNGWDESEHFFAKPGAPMEFTRMSNAPKDGNSQMVKERLSLMVDDQSSKDGKQTVAHIWVTRTFWWELPGKALEKKHAELYGVFHPQ